MRACTCTCNFYSFLERFARSLTDYEVTSPHRVTQDGIFLSHTVHHRRRRDVADVSEQELHFRLRVGDDDLHLELTPNEDFLAGGVTIEHRPDNYKNVSFSKIRTLENACHFHGQVRDHPRSLVALSTCNGLVSNDQLLVNLQLEPPSFFPNFICSPHVQCTSSVASSHSCGVLLSTSSELNIFLSDKLR